MFARTMFAAASLAAAAHASGQCTEVDFENLGAGTVVAAQYDGVTFSTFPGSAMRIVNNIAGGTSSGTRCIRIDPDAGGFSIDALRMVFDRNQSRVTFQLGADNGSYTIRRFSTVAGAGEILPALVVPVGTGGPAAPGVHRFVEVTAPLGNLRRIEITGAQSTFEAIDDLAIDEDGTPPIAEISSPGFDACACGIVTVRGRACDPDGAYGSDTLHYRRVDAAPGAAWTQVGSFTAPQCTPDGVLYSWNTAGAGILEGLYYLRLTVVNNCGLTSTDQVVVYADKSFAMNEGSVRSPQNGAVVGGGVCIDGTVWDHCLENYSVKYRPAAAGVFLPVEPLVPSYANAVLNDPLANWNTTSGGAAVPDGDYLVRVQGTDGCGNTAVVTRAVTVDNTLPGVAITSPANCAYKCGVVQVTGTASDLHLSQWVLDYTGGSLHGWSAPLAQGNANANGVLVNWNTAGLPACDYTLRLRAWDTASINCGSTSNYSEHLVSLHIGAYADCNGDGLLTVADFGCFQTRFLLGCP